DEIGDLPIELQPRLLRLLQDGSYQALGDPAQRQTNIRLIAATNADLKQKVADGTFRADLYYRLKILELKLPAITARREDILPLLRHFLCELTGENVVLTDYFNQASLDLAQNYAWPGNVREVAMAARQARVQLASRGSVSVEIGESDDQGLFLTGPHSIAINVSQTSESKVVGRIDVAITGRSRILAALAEADGNRAKAARNLGVSRSTLYRQMEKLGIAGKVTHW
ncbi:MAG: DNA-binding NtrC family response regulator, partial [Candidatus Krumholzibacteriia bacterium]